MAETHGTDSLGMVKKDHLVLDLFGVIRNDLLVWKVCQHLEAVGLQVGQHLRHQDLVENNKGRQLDDFQREILQTRNMLRLVISYSLLNKLNHFQPQLIRPHAKNRNQKLLMHLFW